MKEEFINLKCKYKRTFGTDKEPLVSLIGHYLDNILNVDKPCLPLLRRPAYPASPRAREALEEHIKEIMDLGFLKKLGHYEQIKVTTPFIKVWHNVKSRMVGDFKALDTYSIPDRYPMPRIHETLTQLSHARLITFMDYLKDFHHSFLTDNSKKLLMTIAYCGIHE
ncbi:hypothetical protein O181_115238 [Austropuccinia psidii MF-1]|uniref:Reverse transcriptase domain-containing protein n=1 Tax=Austropuccinia psidii MF-1 TaxID=1389203 RepID=A0A9Q3PVC3_9BASI|nr:hypothetical protein [Austropuccinia psidii MF-1]